jgi:hypothetical protein
MKALITVLVICSLGGVIGSVFGWQEVRRLSAENAALRAQFEATQKKSKEDVSVLTSKHQGEIEKLESDAKEVFKLRGEVVQLRGGAKAISDLQEANRRLAAQNQTLKTASDSLSAEAGMDSGGQQAFPKESWDFLGYTTPEDALVSAIYSMQQGDTQAYFDSLAPDEQERMAERWQEKSDTEVADKHQSDVAAISGLQVLNRRNVTDTEVLMDVYIDGPGRMETVSMQLVGEDWKFKGYVREDSQ